VDKCIQCSSSLVLFRPLSQESCLFKYSVPIERLRWTEYAACTGETHAYMCIYIYIYISTYIYVYILVHRERKLFVKCQSFCLRDQSIAETIILQYVLGRTNHLFSSNITRTTQKRIRPTCVFVAAGTCLQNRWIATKGDFRS
jgi:hypothetical protein